MKQISSVIARIQSSYLTLVPSERRIADYIMEHPAQSAQMSIDQLSACGQVSKATTTRFCRKLGYSGYKDFKYALILDAADEQDVFGSLDSEDTGASVLKKVSAANCEAIKRTQDILNVNALEKLAEQIFSARRILLLANGGSSVVALDFYHKFLRLGIECNFNLDSRMQEMSAHLLTERDIAIGFTFSGGNKEVIRCMDLAAKKGAKTACFTSTLDAPISKVCETVLCTSNSVKSKITGSIEPRISLLNVVDSLFLLCVIRNHNTVSKSLAETLEVLEEARLRE